METTKSALQWISREILKSPCTLGSFLTQTTTYVTNNVKESNEKFQKNLLEKLAGRFLVEFLEKFMEEFGRIPGVFFKYKSKTIL